MILQRWRADFWWKDGLQEWKRSRSSKCDRGEGRSEQNRVARKKICQVSVSCTSDTYCTHRFRKEPATSRYVGLQALAILKVRRIVSLLLDNQSSIRDIFTTDFQHALCVCWHYQNPKTLSINPSEHYTVLQDFLERGTLCALLYSLTANS
jgi:hypothetical protein